MELDLNSGPESPYGACMSVLAKTALGDSAVRVRPGTGGVVRSLPGFRWSGGPVPRLLLGIGLSYLPVAIALPLLPLVIVRHGGSATAVGLVIGAEAVTATLVRPAAGWLAARGCRRRLFAVACGVVAATTAANAATAAVWVLVIARLALGLGSGASRAVAHGWALELVPRSRRGRSLGLVGLVTTLTVALGPPLGFLLSHTVGIQAAWLLATVPPLLGAAAVAGLPEPPPAALAAGVGRRRLVLSLRTGAGIAVAFAAYAALAAFAAVALSGRGIGGGASVVSAYACGVVVTRLLTGGASDRFGARTTALASAGLQAAGLLLLATAGTLPVAVAGGVLVGCGVANLYPSLALLALEQRNRHERAVIAGSLGSFVDIGVAIGAPTVGLLASRAGYTAAFIVLAAIVFATVATVVAASRGETRSSQRPERTHGDARVFALASRSRTSGEANPLARNKSAPRSRHGKETR
jgi:MFS family permease